MSFRDWDFGSLSSTKHSELYGTALPFYTINPGYIKDEINEEDIRFIIWNTLQKAPYPHSYIHPMTTSIRQTAKMFFEILDEEYETAPANDALTEYFMKFRDRTEAEHKLLWLFGHNYLTEPSVQEYIAQVTASDKYIIPCGPMALFLYEWIDFINRSSNRKLAADRGALP